MSSFPESEDVGIHLSALEDFLEEACFLKGYKHKNVLGTVGIVWKRGDRPMIILPYMAKGSLRNLVKSQTLVSLCNLPDTIFLSLDFLLGYNSLTLW